MTDEGLIAELHKALNDLLALHWRGPGEYSAHDRSLEALALSVGRLDDLPVTVAFSDRVYARAAQIERDRNKSSQ